MTRYLRASSISSAPQRCPQGVSSLSLLAAGTFVLGLSACDPSQVLQVPTPDAVLPSTLQTPQSLGTLENAAFEQFQVAYGGGADLVNNGHEGQINLSGLFTDELVDVETYTTRIQIDARNASPGNLTLQAVFVDLSQARVFADQSDALFNKFAPDSIDHGPVLAIGGFSYLLFAENWCEGVPVSTLNANGTVTYGVPLTRQQLLDTAISHFDSAMTIANMKGDTSTLYLASVGKGRALLDSNDAAAAAAAVAAVPVGYVYNIGTSTNTPLQNNGVWNYTWNYNGFSVANNEGTNGLPFVSANDPRVVVINTGGPGVGGQAYPMILQTLYPAQTSFLPVATGIEAQLIIAENQLRTGGAWLSTLNALRTTVPGLAPLSDPGTPAARVNLLFYERAFWLYLTSHRLGDMRRLVRQYGRAVNTVYPIGISINNIPYGTDTQFQISELERNNPNFHGCLNLNP
jgi:starch-binding outer membrane protein, SusD/RagB family